LVDRLVDWQLAISRSFGRSIRAVAAVVVVAAAATSTTV
jgi:hypothetical protein